LLANSHAELEIATC